MHTDQTYQEMVDTLCRVVDQTPKGKIRKLEQALRLNYEPHSLLFDRSLRSVLPGPATGALFDWMHVLVAGGVAAWEVCGLVQALRRAGIDIEEVDAYISLHTLPKRLGKFRPTSCNNNVPRTRSSPLPEK